MNWNWKIFLLDFFSLLICRVSLYIRAIGPLLLLHISYIFSHLWLIFSPFNDVSWIFQKRLLRVRELYSFMLFYSCCYLYPLYILINIETSIFWATVFLARVCIIMLYVLSYLLKNKSNIYQHIFIFIPRSFFLILVIL